MLLDEDKKEDKGRFQNNPLLILIWAVMPIVLMFASGVAMINNGAEIATNTSTIFASCLKQIINLIIMFVLVACLIAYVYKKDILTFFNLRKAPKTSHLLLAAGIMLSTNTFLNVFMYFNELIPLSANLESKLKLFQETASQGQEFFLNFNGPFEFVMVFLTIAIVPPIAEEIYFRGLLEGVLLDMKIGAFHAIFISAFLFAIMHFQFYYFLPILFMGGVLGYFYYRTKNLWLTILMHLMNNGLIVLLTLSNKSNVTNVDLEGDPPVYVSIIGGLVFCALIYMFHQKTEKTKF